MSSEYPQAPIGKVAKVRSGFAFKSSDWQNDGIPVVKIANVKDGRLEMDGCSYVSKEVALTAKDVLLDEGDILISMTGYVGDLARVRIEDTPCALNQRVGRFHSYDRELIDPSYLFFHLRSKEIRSEIEQKAYGSAQPNVSAGGIEETCIYLPELKDQQAIAHILGTLDDKIELNRKTNKTLEAMAKALFKSWFVDFDPVRTKAEGRPTGLPGEISDLFPDSFEDSELGEIPSGWEVTTVGEVTDLVTKGTTPTSIGGAFSSEGIPFYKVESISDEGHIIPGKCAFIDDKSDALLARSRIEEGDILFSIAGTIGRVAQMTRFDIPANTNQALAIARPSRRRISSTLLFYFLRERGRIDLALSRTVQSVQANFSLSELKSIPLALPQQSPRIALENIFDSLREKISSNQRNSFSVSALRDALLPKLISGEIRIPDAEKMLEEVGV
jgi:type I restriction enzyme S subunit